MIKRQIYLFILIALGISQLCSAKELYGDEKKAYITKVENYLNTLKKLSADFIQVNHDGEIARGKIYLSRPGKLRLNYEEPNPQIIIADGKWLIHHDLSMDVTSHLPLGSSPAYFLLQNYVQLGGGLQVLSLSQKMNIIYISLMRRAEPEYGTLTLIFTENPFALRKWIVQDTQGFDTKVTLDNIRTGIYLDPKLFVFVNSKY
jgi:outer membrane lipoprotein-sorting protein